MIGDLSSLLRRTELGPLQVSEAFLWFVAYEWKAGGQKAGPQEKHAERENKARQGVAPGVYDDKKRRTRSVVEPTSYSKFLW